MRRRRWWVIAALVVAFLAATDDKPQWYRDESAVMEEIAVLLEAPVPYERHGEGWFWAQHVSRLVLPRVRLGEETTRRLAGLLRKLPRGTVVVTHYVREQKERVQELEAALEEHAIVVGTPGVSMLDLETLQKRTHVAGIHRPELLRHDTPRALPRFDQQVRMRRFRWATNLDLDLVHLNELAEESWFRTHRWLHGSPDGAEATSPLPIYLCADSAELRAVESYHGLVGSSFVRRSNVGGYYHAAPLVAVIATHRKAPEYVVHEVVHAVVQRILPSCPDPINEGAAMLLTERILGEREEYGAWAAQYRVFQNRTCIAAREEDLSLARLFSLDYTAFRDTGDSRYYWLSMELVRVLDRENDARFPRDLQRLVRALSGRPREHGLAALSEVYPLAELEALWKEQVRRRGEPR